MKTEDLALAISLFSFLISLLSFVWNVWSKFLYPKARVRVSINVMNLSVGGKTTRSIVALSATNFGPTEVTLHVAISQKRRLLWVGKDGLRQAILIPYNDIYSETGSGPFAGGLPKKLLIGEQFSVYFPVTRSWFDDDEMELFGFSDTFGREHWCSLKNAIEFREKVFRNASS